MFSLKNNSTHTTSSQIPLVPVHERQSSTTAASSFKNGPDRLPSGWPENPRTLRSSGTDVFFEALTDIVIVGLSFLFLIFGFIVNQYDGAPVSEHQSLSNALVEATKYGPTIFPILFAAVVGRTLKGLLAWRLERGEQLGFLDMLAGSYTFVSTITTQLTLRILTFTGPLLVLLWALSPIGGQASLRVMSIGNATTNATVQLNYMVPNRTFAPFITGDDASELAVIDGLSIAALLSPSRVKDSPSDPWSNVKIPMIEHTEQSSDPDNDGWFTMTDDNTVYSSLIGIPISNVTYSNLNTTLNIETSYFHLDCPVIESTWQPRNTNLSSLPWTGDTGDSGSGIYSNETNLCSHTQDPPQNTSTTPRTIVYNTWDTSESEKTGAICKIRTTYVEAQITCVGATCSTSRLRRSNFPHPTSAWTLFDGNDCNNWKYFAYIFVNLITGHPAVSTPVQVYFVDTGNPFSDTSSRPLHTLDPEIYATRLGQLLNTVWAALAGMYSISGGLDSQTSTKNETLLSYEYLARTASTTATRSANKEVIVCHRGWLSALAIASFAIVIASLSHPLIRWYRRAPDFMLNVSTMTRDGPWIACPSNGSNMDSSERSRLMKNVRVRLGDVAPQNDVGHLALSSLGHGNVVAKARRDRLYD